MQHLFGAQVVKLGITCEEGPEDRNTSMLVKCSMTYNGQLWRLWEIHPLCFSSSRLFLLIKTSTWPRLREQFLPGQYTTHIIAGPRLIVMLCRILLSQGLYPNQNSLDSQAATSRQVPKIGYLAVKKGHILVIILLLKIFIAHYCHF